MKVKRYGEWVEEHDWKLVVDLRSSDDIEPVLKVHHVCNRCGFETSHIYISEKDPAPKNPHNERFSMSCDEILIANIHRS